MCPKNKNNKTITEMLTFRIIKTYHNNSVWFRPGFTWVTWEYLPMIEYTLWESLSSSVTTQISSESYKNKNIAISKSELNLISLQITNILYYKKTVSVYHSLNHHRT